MIKGQCKLILIIIYYKAYRCLDTLQYRNPSLRILTSTENP